MLDTSGITMGMDGVPDVKLYDSEIRSSQGKFHYAVRDLNVTPVTRMSTGAIPTPVTNLKDDGNLTTFDSQILDEVDSEIKTVDPPV